MSVTRASVPVRRAAALAAGSLLAASLLGACGDMTPPPSVSGDVTGSPAVGVDEGSPMPTTGESSSVSAVIGSWAAQYGTARNTVLTAVSALGSAASDAEVKKAAAGALTAVDDADGLLPCPDPATEEAYRADLAQLRTELTDVSTSGSLDGAKQLAGSVGEVFTATEDALTEAYS